MAPADASNPDEWDEDDWERFMQRADVRAAKYQELLETLLDHPDRDRIIAGEMGWDKRLAGCGEQRDCSGCDKRFDCEIYDMLCLAAEPGHIGGDPEADALISDFDDLQDIPAYARAHEFALHVQKALHDALHGETADEEVGHAFTAAHMVAAKIAGGHGIGYERDCLCGNIANCKRALCNATRCAQTLAEMSLPKRDAARLLAAANEVCITLAGWIEELRSRAHG